MPECHRFDTIAAIDRLSWNTCFANMLEDYDYFLAIERSNIIGFKHIYYVLQEGLQILCCIPAFITVYDLATTAQGIIRKAIQTFDAIKPGWLSLRLACLGSPETEACSIGMHPSLNLQARQKTLTQLLNFFEQDAKAQNCNIFAIKDVSEPDRLCYGDTLKQKHFCDIASLPTAIMPITFKTLDEYFSSLSRITRKDLKRKMKQRIAVRVEHRRNVDDLLPEILAMYLETKNRSEWQFEELSADYFQQVLAVMGERALCSIYYVNDQPIAANLMLIDEHTLLDKFFCMRGEMGRQYNLYFLSWLENLELCLQHGIQIYQSGQAAYKTKLRLGSKLIHNWIYFKHRNWLLDAVLKMLAPLFAFKLPPAINADA